MNFSTFLLSAISAFGIFLSFGLALLLIKHRNQNSRPANVLLATLLVSVSLRVVKPLLLLYAELPFWLEKIGLTAMLLAVPLLFLYLKCLLENKQKLQWLDSLHLLSALIYLVITLPDNVFNDRVYPFILAQNLVYWGACVYLVGSHWQAHKKDLYNWALIITLSIGFIIGSYVFAFVYDGSIYFMCKTSTFSYSLLVCLLALAMLMRKFVFALPKTEKYRNSKIGETQRSELFEKISCHVLQNQVYLDADLTLQSLAQQLQLGTREMSQIINEQTKTNFSDWINEFRIEDAKRRILSKEYRQQKIAAVAFDSGFNTLSSFNAVFKTKTGYTPTEYRNFHNVKNLN
ncbi:helix-turn-helix domain-containing protein [Runella aurantiaca]|uniref:AraC family transcriptional regulator n=1 Tax=Runella aurantiaca TaxID=2282308 RepID=A0A369I5G6_9BACT|nr:helix-turn-helix domain-containing protein [Runella aurantiaca]RDB02763.1 AraC family transcriptional regulator [Runella aurantiaca]